MLKTNLSTRPFYNERAVQFVLTVIGLVVLAIIVFNIARIVTLTKSQSRLGVHAVEAEDEAQRLRAEAVRVRAQINPKELETVASAAREANSIIDRRAFSWTELFSQFEQTLPGDVRITAVQPRLEKEAFIVGVIVEAKRVEDLDAFIEALEEKGSFHDVRPVEEQTNEQNLIQAVVEGIYTPPPREVAGGAHE
jgi:hypothetical protein